MRQSCSGSQHGPSQALQLRVRKDQGVLTAQAFPAPEIAAVLPPNADMKADKRSSSPVSKPFPSRLGVTTSLATTESFANYPDLSPSTDLQDAELNPEVPLGLNMPEPINSSESSKPCRSWVGSLLGCGEPEQTSPLSWCR